MNKYKAMWAVVLFDLPTKTPNERKHYSIFRTELLKRGFQMMQYSVYCRFCRNEEKVKQTLRSVKSILPNKGEVRLLRITDAQFQKMEILSGKREAVSIKKPVQLSLF